MFSPVTAGMPDISTIVTLAALTPEILVTSGMFILLLCGAFTENKSTGTILGLAVFLLLSLLGLMIIPNIPAEKHVLFSHMFVTDAFSQYVKILLVIATVLTLMLCSGWINREENNKFEFPVLILFSLLGMFLMVSAYDLISLYLGLELSSLPLYVLASFNRDSTKSTEAGIKYFVLGALASGILLFGASLVYGFTGTTSFESLALLFAPGHHASSGVVVGLVLILVAFCFKISAAPFHMWTPDVYEGAPTPVTAYFATASKVAAFALLVRLLIHPFGHLILDWQQVIVAVSIISMIVGALGALTQSNLKRLLAYSSIGHAGYGLMGLAAGTVDGVASVLLYFTLYIAMSAGAFACVMMMMRAGEPVETIADLAGLSRTRPRMAIALSIFMFSMAGIPPLAGFFGKFYMFMAAIHAGLFTLAIIGVLSSVLACFYYLKIVKLMYFDEPAPAFDAQSPRATSLALLVCSLFTFLFFLYPTPLVNAAHTAAEALFP